MKNFDILRYIRQWRYVIVVFCIVGIIGMNFYINSSQQYTATATIEYSNDDAINGKTKYGADIKPEEITSSYVIADAIEKLGLNMTVDSLRSQITIEGIVDEDQEAKKAALLEKGEDYKYYKTQYKISYVCDSSHSKEFAKNVVNQVIRSYISYYGEKYLNNVISGIALNEINLNEHDFLDCAELADYSVKTMLDYCQARQKVDDTFRSSRTGYSFSDFIENLTFLKDYSVPKLYSTVLNNGLTLDRAALLSRLKNNMSLSTVDAKNLKDNISKMDSLMKKYEKKYQNSLYWSTTNDSSGSGSSTSTTDGSSPVIINDVQGDNDSARQNATTTYDTLIQNYVNLVIKYDDAVLKRDYDKDSYNIFKDVDKNTSSKSEQALSYNKVLAETVTEISDIYDILDETVAEYNEYVGADNLSILSTTTVGASINANTYMTFAVLLFGIIGICGAILLGRLGDFANYFMYVDRRAGISNRVRCDMEISKYDKLVLPNNFTCMMFRLERLSSINKRDYGVGNTQLKAFGQILNENAKSFGFVGYNNGNSFLAIFDECNQAKATEFCKKVILAVIDYNFRPENTPIEFSIGLAISDKDNVFNIHELVSTAFKKISYNENVVRKFKEMNPSVVLKRKESYKKELELIAEEHSDLRRKPAARKNKSRSAKGV